MLATGPRHGWIVTGQPRTLPSCYCELFLTRSFPPCYSDKMSLRILELVSIILLTLVSGMYWGPWLALTRSIAAFEPEAFLAIVRRLNQNMAPLMTVLTPVALFSTLPVLFLSYNEEPKTFYLTLVALALFIVTLVVTIRTEVPIVKQIVSWTPSTLPDNWRELRDRWGAFHYARIVPSLIGLILLLIAAIFS
jgi:uncharacterized membrane protein